MATDRDFILYLVTSPSGKKYVGITSLGLKRRWFFHCWESSKGSPLLLHRAIRKYGKDAMVVTELARADTWATVCEMEKAAIVFHGSRASAGYNSTDGGEGMLGYVVSEETRKRLSSSLKGKLRSEETKKRMSTGMNGLVKSPEHCANISKAKLGKKIAKHGPLSEEHKEKLRGVIRSQEWKDKQRIAQLGKPRSIATRNKMSESHTGKPRGPTSEATRIKIRDAHLRRHALILEARNGN
jgi:group I intron endonuclease